MALPLPMWLTIHPIGNEFDCGIPRHSQRRRGNCRRLQERDDVEFARPRGLRDQTAPYQATSPPLAVKGAAQHSSHSLLLGTFGWAEKRSAYCTLRAADRQQRPRSRGQTTSDSDCRWCQPGSDVASARLRGTSTQLQVRECMCTGEKLPIPHLTNSVLLCQKLTGSKKGGLSRQLEPQASDTSRRR